jgi:DNA replication protein DnaC
METGSGSAWPLVGRDDEVRQALASIDDASEFQGVLLVGDSGIGKSTLARALADIVKSGLRCSLCWAPKPARRCHWARSAG